MVGAIVGSIIAAIITAHIGKRVPNPSIGIMFIATGRPSQSSPDMPAIAASQAQAARISPNTDSQATERAIQSLVIPVACPRRGTGARRLAEAVGFEPTGRSPARRFSRPLPSTARPRFLRPAA